jgi:hypothetical protein
MRASDADREGVSARLRDAHAEGRLSMEEFGERLDATYAARTLGELATVTRDLPTAPGTGSPAPISRLPGRWGRHRGAWRSWAGAVLVCSAIWAASAVGPGDAGTFWPVWVAVPWGALLLARTLFDDGRERERPGRRDGEIDHRT